MIYGDPVPALTITYSGFAGSDTEGDLDTPPVVATTGLQGSDVGTYPITVTGGLDNNYSFAYVEGTLTVKKADQTISFTSLPDKVYGDSDFTLSAIAGSSLPVTFVSGNSAVATDYRKYRSYCQGPGMQVGFTSSNLSVATVSGNTVHIVGAGVTTITASQGGSTNYNSAPDVPQTLTVNKADQTISFTSLPDKAYGDSDFTLSAVAGSSLPVTFVSGNTAVATITGNTVHIVGAGTTTITASQAGDANYNPAPDVLQTLTVSKASLTVTADNKTKIFGDPNPQLTITYSGFIGTDGAGVLDNPPVAATTGQEDSDVGSYPITVSGGSDDNYNFIYVAGTLTITRIPQEITITGYPARLLEGDSYTLVASSTSGLAVLFESTDNQLATITDDQITGVSKGNVQIRAYNQGDQNYDAAEAFVTVEVYSTHKDIMHLFTPNGDGINDYWELPDLAAWGKCDVRVYSRSGKLIYSNPDYNNLWDGTSNGNPVPEGAYYYIIKTQNEGIVKGTVNIVR